MSIIAAGQVEQNLRPHPTRPDWYVIPLAFGPTLAGVPEIQFDRKFGTVAHRSHLPLLAVSHPSAQIFLSDLRSQERLDLTAREAFDAETSANNWKLRPHQHVAREFVQARRGSLLAMQMRTGKTASAIAAHDPASGPLVVVAPLPTREVWIKWFRTRWPNKRPVVLQGKRVAYFDDNRKKPVQHREDPGYDVIEADRFDAALFHRAELVFVNYDIIAGWKDFGFRRIGMLVFDECHVLSWKGSATAKRATAGIYMSTSAERVVGLSGTPMWNKPVGLYTMLTCLNPGAWGKSFAFRSRYSIMREGEYGYISEGTANEEEFKARMSEVMLRMTWDEISTNLPPIERTVETVDLTEREVFEVEKQAEAVRDHKKQVTQAGAVARFRRLLAKLKLPAATDAARRVLESEEKVIVWTWHRDIALEIEERLAKVGFPGYVVTGGTDMDLREAIFDKWRSSHKPAPLVITLAVGQVGIDLSAARQEVFAELDFTPAIVAQAEMRPFNGIQPIAATYIIIDHEIERKLLEALQTKCELSYRIGVPAAESAIDVLASTFSGINSKGQAAFDVNALAAAIMSDHPDLEDIAANFHGSAWEADSED